MVRIGAPKQRHEGAQAACGLCDGDNDTSLQLAAKDKGFERFRRCRATRKVESMLDETGGIIAGVVMIMYLTECRAKARERVPSDACTQLCS